MKEVENAVKRQREIFPDREMELAALEEIEKSVKEMKEKLGHRARK